MSPRRNDYYEATIRRMVNKSIEEQERQFEQEHGGDADGALLDYLRCAAQTLGHTPHERELLGGSVIAKRFCAWEYAIQKADLPPAYTPDKISRFDRYIKEEEIQKQRYACNKAQKKERARLQELQRRQKQQ